ncbi:hypothetical protein NHX12_010338 [Muraenolepis orangiensis]|uniref:Lipase domain-containing protein n=1 Tax=Muraenolepis orangiensis TaxID=630683 RepID=A0A9Q0DJE2_9TELE|nr:hypothetical protein NHX12_010338 [Muraenolepis orangiensis]
MYAPKCLLSALVICMWVCKGRACDTFTVLSLPHAIVGTEVEVRLLLYTRPNISCGRLIHSGAELELERPTTFIIHGFRPTGSLPRWLHHMVEQVLKHVNHNVVLVDWNYGAANIDYMRAVRNTRTTAANLTAFIRSMEEHGASLTSIHLIGISLGAHISGFIGAELNGTIGRITGLDAAGPLFRGKPPEDRLDPTDAQFVDVIHTDGDGLGLQQPLGHIDFYPNGGADQLGCPKTILSGSAYFKCDHQRSVFLFLESLNKTCPIRVFPCDTYDDFLDARCTNCSHFGVQGCPVFGYDVVAWKDSLLRLGQSKYFFNTNDKDPFCKTNYWLDIITWNQEVQWGYITVKLYGNNQVAKATIDHKKLKFEKYKDTRLLAQFDRDMDTVEKMSVTFSSAILLGPKHKLRVLRVRLQRVEGSDGNNHRPLCRFDLRLREKEEVTFRPIPCEGSNF